MGSCILRKIEGSTDLRRNRAAILLLIILPTLPATIAALTDLKEDRIQRGRYLVEEVGQCGECHTPRNNYGELDRTRWLQGAPIWFQPINPLPNWAYAAPALAGLGSLTREQTLQVLEKGLGPQGSPVRRPMHRYHLSREDAEAIADYLQSLK